MDRIRTLVVPGWTSSGPDHWQSRWERSHPDWRRVEMGDWDRPDPEDWVARIEDAVAEPGPPAVLVAHSLGSIAVARWAAAPGSSTGRVAAAFLVAPPDVEREETPEELRGFAPIARRRLPFHTVLVTSRNDPWIAFNRARELAAAWGADLEDAGEAGHLNTDAGFGPWPWGERVLTDLVGRVTRDRRRPGTAGARLGRAFFALLVGFGAAAALVTIAEVGGSRWGSGTGLLPVVALVAAAAWAVTVVPLALWADHRTGFFSPRAAPLVGAVCGVAALFLFFAVWGRTLPWMLLVSPLAEELGLTLIAATTGAAIWTTYTGLLSRL